MVSTPLLTRHPSAFSGVTVSSLHGGVSQIHSRHCLASIYLNKINQCNTASLLWCKCSKPVPVVFYSTAPCFQVNRDRSSVNHSVIHITTCSAQMRRALAAVKFYLTDLTKFSRWKNDSLLVLRTILGRLDPSYSRSSNRVTIKSQNSAQFFARNLGQL
ncbi:uncharacterized protein EV420DRAFT_588706 [Desarmillaria tabescens]|uniref:Uncharacterized protein n=1 Tax=Armillaria tabescens TaxID=1929756 RepID=A0AA39N2W9_ARMTA|nr:uncharacterized protein EV420DRAFT_588706 [Desarmillaria tabescens]KAK0455210.1 hypothetical protein EV420DRAFT_588706 [Desarmillaria tabescens]